MGEEDLEEKLFELMREYQQPVVEAKQGFGRVFLAGGLVGAVLLGGALYINSQFFKPEVTLTPYPTKAIVAIVPTATYTSIPSTFNPTNTPVPASTPTYTPTPRPTNTPTPTFTQTPIVIVVTATPIPSPTPPANTPPDTILKVGQPWSKDGLELTLVDMKYGIMGTYDVTPDFSFRNKTTTPMSFTVDTFDITIVDNNGNIYHQEGNCKRQFNLSPDQSERVYSFRCPGGDNFRIDYFKASVQYLDVIVRNFGRIDQAKWRVPIYH